MSTYQALRREKNMKNTPSPVLTVINTDPLLCRTCGSPKWGYHVTYTTELDTVSGRTDTRRQTNEELRCGSCGRKGTIENNNAIRSLKIFHQTRSKEATKL